MARAIGRGDRRWAHIELSTLANDPLRPLMPTYGGTVRLLPQDRLLVERGGAGLRMLELYYDLLLDSHVYSVMDKQLQEIISREWSLESASDSGVDKEATIFCKQVLDDLGLDRSVEYRSHAIANKSAGGLNELVRGLGFAYFIGFIPAEIIWAQQGGQIIAEAISIKDARRFMFDVDSEGYIYPKLFTREDAFKGLFLPPRKFIFHTNWAVPVEDPYGAGVARQCYYPVQWKREALTYWLSLIDKHVDPTAIGVYPDQTSDEKIQQFHTAIANIAQESSIVMPEGFELDFKERSLTGAAQVLTDLVEFCNKSISLAILGEATTGEAIAGSNAREEISNSIRLMKAKAISDSINSTINNTLLAWLCFYNYPDATPPKLIRRFEEAEDIDKLVSNITQLANIGYKADPAFIAERTGIPQAKVKPKTESSNVLADQQKLLTQNQV